MKKHFTRFLQAGAAHLAVIAAVLFLAGSGAALTGCKKARLFVKGDTLAAQPSQFHFFNSFAYDSLLSFSVDGLAREKVARFSLSSYYPSSSSFNLNSGQPNSKLINIYDPLISTLYANVVSNTTFTFEPNTSYLVFPLYPAFDTVSAPMRNTVPTLAFYPEDVYHPFDGTTGVRLLDMTAGANVEYGYASLTMTPDIGQGTSTTLSGRRIIALPEKPSDSYQTTQKGLKKLTLTIRASDSRYRTLVISFLPVNLDDGKNYSFFAVGDAINYETNLLPLPKLFLMQDGVSSSLRELTVSNVSFSAYGDQCPVTIVNGAYNVTGYAIDAAKPINGIGIRFNDNTATVKRWPDSYLGTEDIGLGEAGIPGASGLKARIGFLVIPGNAYQATVTPGLAFSPIYDQFSQNLEPAHSYTYCMLPDNSSANRMGHLFLENDLSPGSSVFKLRFVNIMGGSPAIDIHNGSPSGPVIASSVAYGVPTDYIVFNPNLTAQNLYVTAAGSTTPLFQTGAWNQPISLPFTGGNSGTIYLMGLLPGIPYSGDPGYYKPYVYFNDDASTNYLYAIPSTQLYYQL